MGCFQPSSSGSRAQLPFSHPKPPAQADSNTKVIAQRSPYPVDVVAGSTVYFCTCGRSTNQPFCDGKHVGTAFAPLAYTPEQTGKEYFCGCKATKFPPKCDGSHKHLRW